MSEINTDNRVVSIEKVHPNKWNPKKPYEDTPEGRANWERLKRSISKHGQIDPLLVREVKGGFEIVNGFHRHAVALELGWKEVEVKNLGRITDARAKAIAIATEDARIPLDMVEVAKIVKEILDTSPDEADSLPYSEEEQENMKSLIEYDWKEDDEPDGTGSEEDDDEPYTVTIPKSHVARWKKMLKQRSVTDEQLIAQLIEGKN